MLSAVVITLMVGCGSSSDTSPATGDNNNNTGTGTGVGVGTGTGTINTGGNPTEAGVSEVDGGAVFLEIIKRAQFFRDEVKEVKLEGTTVTSTLISYDHSDGNRTRVIEKNFSGSPVANYVFSNYDENDEGTVFNGTARIDTAFGTDIYFDTNLTVTGVFAHTEVMFGTTADRNDTNLSIYGEIQMQDIVIDDIALYLNREDRQWTIDRGRFYIYKVKDSGELETSPFRCDLLPGVTTPISLDYEGDVISFTLGCSDSEGNPVEFNYTR